MRYLKSIFGWIGVILTTGAIATAFGSTARDVEMIQAVAIGIAALASFRASEFFADKEK